MSLFNTLRSGATGLYASQMRIDIVSSNISRANDPTYSRQRAITESIGFRDIGPGTVGMGIEISEILRSRDAFLDARYRDDRSTASQFGHMTATLGQLEALFDEVSGSGLGTVMSEFWDGWNEVSNTPTDPTAKVSLIGKAKQLATTLHNLENELGQERDRLDGEISYTVGTINTLTGQIASINADIVAVSKGGEISANDLLDRRDALVDQLSQLIDVDIAEGSNGIIVRSGGLAMVEGASAHRLELETEIEGESFSVRVVYGGDGTGLAPRSGTLAAMLEERDEIIPEISAGLDEVAVGLIDAVNDIHREGYSADGQHTGLDFFTGDSARTIAVNDAIAADPSHIATSESGLAGDNEIALQLAELRDRPVLDGATIGDKYNNLVLAIGLASQEAQFSESMAISLSIQSDMQREQVKGVNLDEEMVDLISLQNAYQASATVVSTVDELIQSTLTMVG